MRSIESLIRKAKKARLALALAIGVGCHCIVASGGLAARTCPGNRKSTHFNLSETLRNQIPCIGDQPTLVIMHNDAVVQGQSEMLRMVGAKAWAVVAISTGLGNASFVNNRD